MMHIFKGERIMNKIKLVLIMSFMLCSLYACNRDVDEVNGSQENNDSTEITDQIDNNTAQQSDETMDPDQTYTDNTEKGGLSSKFTSFALDIEYENDISYEAEYTNNQNKVTAEIENEISKEEFTGDEANKLITKAFDLLNIDKDTPDEEVRSQVLEAFKLEENYKKFDLTVTFETGEMKEYHFKN